MPTDGVSDKPAVVVDRLRSWWVTPGVYLILEGVLLALTQGEDSAAGEVRQQEHFLFALDGELDQLQRLGELIAAHALPQVTLWDKSNVIRTANDAGDYYLQQGDKFTGGFIHQRLSAAMPDSHVVLSNAGRYFLKAEMTLEAAGYLERAYELAPHVPEVAVNFMVLRQLEGKRDEAEQVRETLVSEHADHPLVKVLGLADPEGTGSSHSRDA